MLVIECIIFAPNHALGAIQGPQGGTRDPALIVAREVFRVLSHLLIVPVHGCRLDAGLMQIKMPLGYLRIIKRLLQDNHDGKID